MPSVSSIGSFPRLATPSASAKPDQFHQSALTVWADPLRDKLSAANSAGTESTRVALQNHSQTLLDFIMAARVLLLMALTGLFAAAWNSDCPEATSSLQASATSPPESKTVVGANDQEWMVSEISPTITISREFDPTEVLLPKLIVPGTYRVVDAEGRVGWITVPAGDQSEFTIDEPEPFYNSQSESGRWYFIRVTTAPLIAAPQTGDAVLR